MLTQRCSRAFSAVYTSLRTCLIFDDSGAWPTQLKSHFSANHAHVASHCHESGNDSKRGISTTTAAVPNDITCTGALIVPQRSAREQITYAQRSIVHGGHACCNRTVRDIHHIIFACNKQLIDDTECANGRHFAQFPRQWSSRHPVLLLGAQTSSPKLAHRIQALRMAAMKRLASLLSIMCSAIMARTCCASNGPPGTTVSETRPNSQHGMFSKRAAKRTSLSRHDCS